MHGSHSHRHGPAGHAHGGADRNERRMGFAAFLTGAFMFAEVAGGIAAGSLALLADAGHMLTDFASLALAWFGFRLARRPADWKRTYGFDRFQVLVAFANGLALFAIAAWIVYEAIERLTTAQEVSGGIMVVIAVLGLTRELWPPSLCCRGPIARISMCVALPSMCSATCSVRWRRLLPGP